MADLSEERVLPRIGKLAVKGISMIGEKTMGVREEDDFVLAEEGKIVDFPLILVSDQHRVTQSKEKSYVKNVRPERERCRVAGQTTSAADRAPC